MTGELTLRGQGAADRRAEGEAARGGARRHHDRASSRPRNAPELSEIPPHVTAKLTVKPVRTMDEVLEIALVGLAGGDEEGGGQGLRRDPAPRRKATSRPGIA